MAMETAMDLSLINAPCSELCEGCPVAHHFRQDRIDRLRNEFGYDTFSDLDALFHLESLYCSECQLLASDYDFDRKGKR